MSADPGPSRAVGAPADVSMSDRLHAVEDELRSPWTLLTAAIEELAHSIADVEGRRAIEIARRTTHQLHAIAEAFFAGKPLLEAISTTPAVAAVEAAAGDTRLRVLVADDNADLCAYLATMLSGKYAVDTVRDGAALVAAARTRQPDVIVSDVRMPFIDGYEAARMLREDPRTANIPIVLLSGNNGSDGAALARDAGVDDYLVKPFTVAELMARVDALARRRSAFKETIDPLANADVRTWRLLAAAAERFVGITRPVRALDALGDIVVPAIGDWYCAYLIQGEAIALKSVVHRQSAKRDFAWVLEREYPAMVGDASPLDRAIASGEPLFIDTMTPEIIASMAVDPHHAAILTALQFHSAAIVPFTAGEARGAIVVMGSESRPFIQAGDVTILQRIVDRAAGAYHAATRTDQQQTVASALQRALLPGVLPAVEGLTLSVAYAHAEREAHVGGDWYDAMALADGRVLLSIGDVAGHGLNASVAMSSLRNAIRQFAREDPTPSTILKRANALLIADCRVATALIAVLEPLSLDVTIAAAGHPGPAIVEPNGDVSHVAVPGVVLGTTNESVYEDLEFRLEPGSSMLLYTDGLVATEDGARVVHLERALRTNASIHDDLAGSIFRDLFGDSAPNDDVALLAVTASATLDRLDLTLPAEPSNAVRARTAISRFLHGVGMADRAGDLLVAAGEAIGNAIEHAYHGQPGAIRVRGRSVGESVTVEIRDFGQWHSGTASEGRGFGLPLMRAFADAVDVERTPFGTRVELQARHARVEEPA
jgi:CheY-like chemotaxis protein/anti-sigma regulatory factor (Ser/Thr protein kinase)